MKLVAEAYEGTKMFELRLVAESAADMALLSRLTGGEVRGPVGGVYVFASQKDTLPTDTRGLGPSSVGLIYSPSREVP